MYIPLTDDEIVEIIVGIVLGIIISIGIIGLLKEACRDIKIKQDEDC